MDTFDELCIARLSRTENPQTSKDVAKRIVDSGELNRQEEEVYTQITRYSKYQSHAFTTKDIAAYMAYRPYDKAYDICRRRFSGLFNKFKIVLTGGRRDGCRVYRLL